MKILIADFQIASYSGIVEYVAAMVRAFHDLGHTVDIVQMTSGSINQKTYQRKIKEFESGEWQKKLKIHSQSGAYEQDKTLGYWKNNYYGYFLPPNNRIGVFEEDALEHWHKLADDADIILWNFMPTKNSMWKKKDKKLDFWWRFFDLPSTVKQIFLVHDAYFNVRASNVSALKDKIYFLACAHLAAYQCCEEIGIPRVLLFNPRYIDDDAKMPIKMMNNRNVDFFAAHNFKSMKHIEELVACVPYLPTKAEVRIAGTGIEYFYMTSKEKIKPRYICTSGRDPDLPKQLDGKISLWDRALQYGMNYVGLLTGGDVVNTLKNTKFAVDPSWSKHYAKYCRTHINGFIIEAMLNGAYPVLRDYRGLEKVENDNIYDPLFENIRAIIIPWDATPKQFAEYLKEAMRMPQAKFLSDTKHNFELVKQLFNAKQNAKEIIRLAKGGKKLIQQELETGEDSETVKNITSDIMENFFNIKLPIKWKTK